MNLFPFSINIRISSFIHSASLWRTKIVLAGIHCLAISKNVSVKLEAVKSIVSFSIMFLQLTLVSKLQNLLESSLL